MRITYKPTHTLVLLCAIGFWSAAQAQTARNITLPEALTIATQNIDAQIAQQQLLGARADVLTANHAPLPTLTTSISQIDLQNGVGPGSWLNQKRVDKSMGIDWTWERGSKRALRTEAAKQAVNASEQELREALIQQRLAAQSAFFDLLAAQERIRQISSIAASAKQLAGVADKRLAAGDLSTQDAARSNIEAQRAQNDLTQAEQDRTRAELALNLVLDIGSQKLVALRTDQTTMAVRTTLVEGQPNTSLRQAQAEQVPVMTGTEAIDRRPDVQATHARVLAAQSQLDNAVALKSNDITLGTAIDHWPGTSNRLLMLRLQMPLQMSSLGGYNFQGEINRASAQLAIAQAQLERTRHAAANDELRLAQELANNQTRAKSYTENIAPSAKRVADQAEIAYNKGALSLTDLLESRRTWRATSLEAIAAQTDYDKAHTAFTIRADSLK